MTDRLRCPVCRNATGSEADGIVVRKYRPFMQDGKMVNKLSPLYRDELHCSKCGTTLLVRKDGEWVMAWGVK